MGRAVLDMLATGRGLTLAPEERDRIAGGLLSLPPHPDVVESLERLRDGGFRLAALTNLQAGKIPLSIRDLNGEPRFAKDLDGAKDNLQ